MYDVAIRFTLDAGNVDFYTYEIGNSKLVFVQANERQINQTIPAHLINKGDIWKTLLINFIENRKTTRAKINQLIDEKKEMICYYAYGKYTTSKYINCIYVPKIKKKVWFYGNEGAKIIHELEFWQSS